MSNGVKTKEPKMKETSVCQCGATRFQGPTQIVEFVGGAPVVVETLHRCVNCHKEYDQQGVAKLDTRTVQLPG